MIDPVHFIRFASARQAFYETRIAAAIESIATKIAKHEATRWHRWFGFKYDSSFWDLDEADLHYNGVWIKQLDKLKQRAEYHRKMETQMVCPDEDFLALFYTWCAENSIPF